jgi:aryl-alcohol dehydrogenase-like predicted oxidoreductase
MIERALGSTGLRVSEVGFGAWGLGDTMWLGVPEPEGDAALQTALDEGVTFIDTALAYGDGHSERRIARVLKARGGAGGVAVATKIPPKDYRWPGRADASLEEVFPASWVVTCCETSLRNLGVEALDLQQFHVWHDAWLSQPAWGTTRAAMEMLKRQGKVLHWGISVNDHDPDSALRTLADPLFESMQVIYNIFDRAPEGGAFDLAREKNLGVIVRVPFDEGALTGAVRADTTFPEGDWRHRYFRDDRKAEAARRSDALAELLGEEAATLPELALRFVLSRPEVSTVIPGMRRPDHARSNAAVSDGRRLSPALLRRLRAHAWAKNWYSA